jgi:hypothetical protein
MEFENRQVTKKRTLTKVRRDFLHKKENEDESKEVDPSTRILNNNNIHLIAGNIGLVEINRQIYLEPGFVNMLYAVRDFEIEKRPNSSIINLSFQIANENSLAPWEYTVKRLESYGDLNLATWAYKIKTYYTKHVAAMANYYELMNLKTSSQINEARENARMLCKDIEKERSFFMARYLAKIDTIELVSASFDEGFLKELGFDINNFSYWALSNGLPKMLEKDSSLTMKFAQLFLNSKITDYKPLQKEPQHMNSLLDKNGGRKQKGLQTIMVTETAEEGIYLNIYCTLVKDQDLDLPLQNLVNDKSNLKTYKKSTNIMDGNQFQDPWERI